MSWLVSQLVLELIKLKEGVSATNEELEEK